MTTQEIIDSLFGPKGLSKPISKGRTQDRVKSAQGYCIRAGVSWESVLAAMTEDQRKELDAFVSGATA